MRGLVLISVVLVVACVHEAQTAFAPNQVWTLKEPPSPNARLVVDGLDTHEGRTVVRYSIVMQPPPEATARTVLNMESSLSEARAAGLVRSEQADRALEAFDDLRNARAVQYRVSSMFYPDARWRPGAMSIATASEPEEEPLALAQISHFATYADVLHPTLGQLAREAPPEIMGERRDAEGAITLLFPEDDEAVLNRPLSEMLEDIAAWWRGELVAEPPVLPDPGPSPPSRADAGETPIEDAVLDAACRARLTPPPPDARFMEAELRMNQRLEALGERPLPPTPDFVRTFSDVTVTWSETWGSVWRAETSFEGAPDVIKPDRVRCWRPVSGDPDVMIANDRFDAYFRASREAGDHLDVTPP